MKAIAGVALGSRKVRLSNGTTINVEEDFAIGENVWAFWNFTRNRVLLVVKDEGTDDVEEEYHDEEENFEMDYDYLYDSTG